MRWKYSAHFEFEDLCDEGILNLGTDRKSSATASAGHKAILEKNTETKIERDLCLLVTPILSGSGGNAADLY